MSGGYKSPLIFERLSSTTTRKSGYISMLGFWLGGIGAVIISPTPPIPEPVVVTVDDRRWPGPSFTLFREGEKEPSFIRRRKEEEEIIFL